MATNWYSTAFHETGIAATARSAGGFQAAPGTQNGPFKYSKIDLSTAAAVAAMANTDVLLMQPVKPYQRLRSLFVSSDANFNSATTFNLNIGLGSLDQFGNYLGLIGSPTLFASAVLMKATAIAHVDEFTESGVLVNLDRMLRFWEFVNIVSPGTYAASPRENWVILARLGITGAVSAGGIVTMEAEIYPD